MLSGRRLDLLDPSPLDIEISDIAHGLARVARWNGQTSGKHAYSVAQHSLAVEYIVGRIVPDCSPMLRLATLLHDAPEYVIGDMISPFKKVLGGNYKAVETRLEAAIHIRFGLPPHPGRTIRGQIKRADQISAFYEATVLAGFSEKEAVTYFGRPRGFSPDGLDLTPRPVSDIQRLYLDRFADVETAFRSQGAPARRKA
ncbi:HD family hydrolase [Oricola cellulosilytica]|uniref:HD family hydrolase n=1 Tax=Oricola cellulosilytica TaxID=1429082 RepID=A0A4R0PBH3_9HYPH|nr:HD family hydrolase [Oricola cellulosilytica]TCD14610.1 HD family hydrolase [Oricola cellulosilytica]